MMKKLVALLMALALLCSSIAAFAEEDRYGYTSTDDLEAYKKHAAHFDTNCDVSGSARDDIEPTCNSPRYKWYRCDLCMERYWEPFFGTQLQHNDATPDTDNVTETVTTPATCQVPGAKTVKCKVCGKEWTNVSYTDPDAHTSGRSVTVKPDTEHCGYIYNKCVDCDFIFSTTIIKPVGFTGNAEEYDLTEAKTIPTGEGNNSGVHTKGFPAKTNVESTDCKPVTNKYWCIVCGEAIEVTYSKDDHTALEADINAGKIKVTPVDPTCTTAGYYKYEGTCSVCKVSGLTWYKERPALKHDYDPDNPDEVVKATCTTAGYKVYTCRRKDCPNEDHKVIVKTDDASKHSWETNDKQAAEFYLDPASCTEAGSYGWAIVCEDCGEIKPGSQDKNVVVDTLDHQAVLNEMAKKNQFYKKENGKIVIADGIAAGTTIQDKGDVKTATIDGVEKVIGEYGKLKTVYTPATCEEKGSIVVTCLDCNAKIEQALDEKGHIISEEFGGPFDCTKGGTVLLQCDREGCDYSVVVNVPAKPAHEFGSWADGYAQRLPGGSLKYYWYTEDEDYDPFDEIALCEDYYIVHHCNNPHCNAEDLELVKATEDHVINNQLPHAEGKPTCLTGSSSYFTCTNCKQTIFKDLKPNGHTMVAGKVLKEATCTVPGSRQYYCKDCAVFDEKGNLVQSVGEKEGIEVREIPTIAHKFAHFDSGVKACKDRIEYDYCVMCDLKMNEKTTPGHKPGADYQLVTPAKCTDTGLEKFTCTVCHQPITQVIPAKGHDYQRNTDGTITSIEDVKKNHAKACKFPENGDCVAAKCETDAVHVITCGECKEKLTWTVADTAIGEHTCFVKDAQGNVSVVNSFTVVVVPTCETAGYAMYNCAVCGSLEKYELPKLPHNMQPHYDDQKELSYFRCEPIWNNTDADYDGVSVLRNLINGAYKNEAVTDAVVAKILERTATGDMIGTFGEDDHIVEVPATTPEYEITKASDTRGKLVLKSDDMYNLDDACVRITWRYTLGNGDTISFVTTREVSWKWDEKAEESYGTFKLTGLSVPEDAVCNFIYIEVVNDPDADEKYAGQYDTFGKTTIR